MRQPAVLASAAGHEGVGVLSEPLAQAVVVHDHGRYRRRRRYCQRPPRLAEPGLLTGRMRVGCGAGLRVIRRVRVFEVSVLVGQAWGLCPVSPIPAPPPGCRAAAAVIEAKDAKNAALRAGLAGLVAELEAERELVRRLELRVAELERWLRMDSSDSGRPARGNR
jgi:hypothetical protein